MPRFLILGSQLGEGTGELREWTEQALALLGGRVLSFDFTVGQPDLVIVVEAIAAADLVRLSGRSTKEGRFKIERCLPLVAANEPVPVRAEVRPPERDEAVVAFGSEGLPPDAYELLAGRFTRFSELRAFNDAFQRLPGMYRIETKQFVRGTILLLVHYNSPIPFEKRLAELRQFAPEVHYLGGSRYELVVHANTRSGRRLLEPTRVRALVMAKEEVEQGSELGRMAEPDEMAARDFVGVEHQPIGHETMLQICRGDVLVDAKMRR